MPANTALGALLFSCSMAGSMEPSAQQSYVQRSLENWEDINSTYSFSQALLPTTQLPSRFNELLNHSTWGFFSQLAVQKSPMYVEHCVWILPLLLILFSFRRKEVHKQAPYTNKLPHQAIRHNGLTRNKHNFYLKLNILTAYTNDLLLCLYLFFFLLLFFWTSTIWKGEEENNL